MAISSSFTVGGIAAIMENALSTLPYSREGSMVFVAWNGLELT